MRAIAIASVLALAAGCSSPCKDGTALITVRFGAAAAGADRLDVSVAVDNGTPVASSVPRSGSDASGTLEVTFPHGYPSGHSLTVTVTASHAGTPIATDTDTFPLAAGCTAFGLTLGANNHDAGLDLPPANLPMPKIAATPDLVGFPTALDGSGSTDPMGQPLTFAWAFAQVPSGSTVTAASLASQTAAKTRFEPDRGGDYQVTLTATAMDGRIGRVTATVTVPTAPVFTFRLDHSATIGQMGAGIVGSDGAGARYLSCPYTQDGGVGVSGGDPHELGWGGRAFEPMAGGTPRFAFLYPTSLAGTSPPQLLVATPASDCAGAPPVRVDANLFNDHLPISMRFSPDGTRIAYIDMPFNTSQSSYRLVTVSVDGDTTKRHVVRSNNAQLGFTPPFWVDNNTVGWVESSGSGGDVYKAPDQTGAGETASGMRTTLLHCDSTIAGNLYTLNQVEQGKFGLIVAGSTGARTSGFSTPTWSAMNLWLMTAADCSTTGATTKLLDGEPYGGEAWDFAVSPDGLTILYSSTRGLPAPDAGLPHPSLHDLYMVPSDGSSQPVKFAGDPALDDLEPRWIAGGRQVAWISTALWSDTDAGASQRAGRVMIANSDGTHLHGFQPSVLGVTTDVVDTGLNRSFECTASPGNARSTGHVILLLSALALALALTRRRSS